MVLRLLPITEALFICLPGDGRAVSSAAYCFFISPHAMLQSSTVLFQTRHFLMHVLLGKAELDCPC